MNALEKSYQDLKNCLENSAKFSDAIALEEIFYNLKNDFDSTSQQLTAAINARDGAKLKIFELTRSLEIEKNNKKELISTLNALKIKRETDEINSKDISEVSQDDRNISIIASENSLLQSRMHRNLLKNMELKRNIESLESDLTNIKLLEKEFSNREIEAKKTAEELMPQLKRIIKGREMVKKVEENVGIMEEKEKLNEDLRSEIKKIEKENVELENEEIGLMAECETLKSIIENHSEIIMKTDMVSLIDVKWKENRSTLMDQNSEMSEKIIEVIERLNEQIIKNNKIIEQIQEIKKLCVKINN